jgi:hypothetical protein
MSQLNEQAIFAILIIVLFFAQIAFLALGIFISLKKKITGNFIISISTLLVQIGILLSESMGKFGEGLRIVLAVFGFLLGIGSVAVSFLYIRHNRLYGEELEEEEKEENNKLVVDYKTTKKYVLIMNIVSLIGLLSLFIIPLFSYTNGVNQMSFWLLQALSNKGGIAVQIGFIVVLLTFIGLGLYFINTISYYFNYEKVFVKKSNSIIFGAFAITLVYFIIGYLISFVYNLTDPNAHASTVSFIPLILMTVVLVVYSIIKGKYGLVDEKALLETKKALKFESLIYLIILTVVSIGLLFINVIEVEYGVDNIGAAKEYTFTGLELLQNHSQIGGGYQILTFVILAVMITSFVLLTLSVSAFASKSDDYHKINKISMYIDIIFMFILGIAGFYFKIAQKINEENIMDLLSGFGYTIPSNLEVNSEINSQCIVLFIVDLAVLIVAMFRGQLNYKPQLEAQALNIGSEKESSTKEELNKQQDKKEEIFEKKDNNLTDFDPCPVFTELDGKKAMFDNILAKKKEYLFGNPNLPDLVKFIVDYARESRLHLSYTHEDIATFVAGLGASRLTILQGMSGTGKTSLPKIFSEAVLGNCEIVEVESSWRDKNELLGYYNEFSKTYSPKKFTERLYKAKLNPEVVTFIVLDEMNLSRIEYYFSDFLSLMEHEEHKRRIKLLNIKLQRTQNNQKLNYLALEEGHTIKIPTNVWFIGTANRDESTFEISDKVYDRAQTMNFNKRAPKVRNYSKPIPQKFMSYQTLSTLLKDAIAQGTFEAEDNQIIKEVEKILQPFNISFGNRVLKQIEEFVKIYCACFNNDKDVVDEAVEKILLSKVVAKLEFKNVDNKDKLVKQFNKLNLFACSEFVSKLNED